MHHAPIPFAPAAASPDCGDHLDRFPCHRCGAPVPAGCVDRLSGDAIAHARLAATLTAPAICLADPLDLGIYPEASTAVPPTPAPPRVAAQPFLAGRSRRPGELSATVRRLRARDTALAFASPPDDRRDREPLPGQPRAYPPLTWLDGLMGAAIIVGFTWLAMGIVAAALAGRL